MNTIIPGPGESRDPSSSEHPVGCVAPLHGYRLSPVKTDRGEALNAIAVSSLRRRLQGKHPVDHLAGKAEIIRGIGELGELGARHVTGNLLVRGEEVEERLPALHHRAADVVDDVVGALAAE